MGTHGRTKGGAVTVIVCGLVSTTVKEAASLCEWGGVDLGGRKVACQGSVNQIPALRSPIRGSSVRQCGSLSTKRRGPQDRRRAVIQKVRPLKRSEGGARRRGIGPRRGSEVPTSRMGEYVPSEKT